MSKRVRHEYAAVRRDGTLVRMSLSGIRDNFRHGTALQYQYGLVFRRPDAESGWEQVHWPSLEPMEEDKR